MTVFSVCDERAREREKEKKLYKFNHIHIPKFPYSHVVGREF